MDQASSTDAPLPDPVGGYVLGDEVDYWTIPLAQRPFLFRNMDELRPYPTRTVRHGLHVRPLPHGPELDFRAEIGGRPEDLDSFMLRHHTAALMVVKDGEVRAERYRYGNTPRSRWVMFSITKSIVSTALAAAVQAGRLGSLDDLVTRHIPELAGTAYDGVTVLEVVNMTSGVDRSDKYELPDPRLNPQEIAYFDPAPGAVFAYLRTLGRAAPPGTWMNYNSMDTFVLGQLISRVTGMSVAEYISDKIWVPGGMEDDAYMRLTAAGQEICHGGLSATLRDIARFGLYALDRGIIDGQSLVPQGWFEAVSSGDCGENGIRAPGCTQAAPDFGYARQWWTLPRGRAHYELGDDDGFAGLGIYGQFLYVVPKLRLVVVIQSADLTGFNPELTARGRELVTAIAGHFRAG